MDNTSSKEVKKGGRPKDSKTNREMSHRIGILWDKYLKNNEGKGFKRDLDALTPKQRMDIMVSMLPFIVAKRSATTTEHTGEALKTWEIQPVKKIDKKEDSDKKDSDEDSDKKD
jgi:hypothetical protein